MIAGCGVFTLLPRIGRSLPSESRGAAYPSRMTSQSVRPRVAAMLASYEARSIDADDLLGAVDEARDRGRSEREDIAWAAASYWRSQAETS